MSVVGTAYDRIDPLRPAAARWRRAYAVVALGDAQSRRDDTLTARVTDYLRAIRCESCPPKCPATRFRLLHRAHQIYDQNGELRWELEARLMAGQGDREVARRTGLTRAAVALYHDVFAACRDRLGATDWVLATFIGPGPTVGFAPGDMGAVWRWVGYFGGPRKLDVVIAATSKTPRRHDYHEADLEAARRFVLVAQIPVTARPTALAAVVGMIDETERRAAPAEATVSPFGTGTPVSREQRAKCQPLFRPPGHRRVGKSLACGATPS